MKAETNMLICQFGVNKNFLTYPNILIFKFIFLKK